jgi:ribulose-phosphate 3-epimerase
MMSEQAAQVKLIVPSIIAGSQQELDKRLIRLQGVDSVMQLDVMDGIFVGSRSLDFDFILPEGRFEAHLMVSNPEAWAGLKSDKVDTVLAHIESCQDPDELIRTVRKKDRKVGFALRPETPIDIIKPYLKIIDQVLVLTVDPGMYGAEFIPETLEKVRQIRALSPDIDIEVDGGITPETIALAADAGANIFVSGSFIMDSDDPAAAIAALRKEVESHGQERTA